MGLKAYYDGSGKNDNVTKVLTLAGFAASERIWNRFESEWKDVLERHDVQSFHMSDAMTFNGQFELHKGWDETRRQALLKDFFNILGKFRTDHFEAYSCSVILDDYRRAKCTIPELRSPEALCVNFCVGNLQLAIEYFDTPKPIKIYFDRNEAFLKTINNVWTHVKNKSQTKG
jgi:hypothetical protein